MIEDKELRKLFQEEFGNSVNNIIWQNDSGEYEAFGRYRIVPLKPGFRVFVYDTDVGVFSGTKTAISWCVADKYKNYNLARELLDLDNSLENIKNDIFVRAGQANRSRKPEFREDVDTKLETKIIRKNILEKRLAICVNLAKYLQQRGFNNETARPGKATTNKTSR